MFIGIAAIAVIALWVFSTYNTIIVLKNRIQNAWAQINVELKRRYDLIPNLVETVKGYMKFEKEVLENVVKARSEAMQAKGPVEAGVAENNLTGTLKSLFAVVENYPDLKADQNVLKLQEELTTTENKIAFSRQFYNDIVMRYNQAIQVIPGLLVAMIFGFKKEEYFQVDIETVKEPPKVNLGL